MSDTLSHCYYGGDVQELPARFLTSDTCQHFGYRVGKLDGKWVQMAPYCDASGTPVALKVRDAAKNFHVLGKLKDALPLFGQHLWRDGGKKVVITEGEIDCMSVSQVQGNKWPVVSVPNGAPGAKKALQAALEWLERFDEVILMFDQDEPGKAAVAECAALFTPGKCKVASLPLKDPNELLKAGRGGEIVDAIWGAKPYRPDGVVDAASLVDRALVTPVIGTPWFLPELTELTFGRRPGELYGFGAGTGVGKTDLFTQSIEFDLRLPGVRVGVLYLEQDTVETLVRVAGKRIQRVLHVPGECPTEERAAAIQSVADGGNLFLYDAWGMNDWETVKAKMRFMISGLGCTSIYLDHLTALVAGEEDENGALKEIMGELAGLAKTTGAMIHYVSHLNTPEGKPHEEGGRVMIRHFRGSRAIGFWTHFMFGLERNQQAEDPAERSRSTLRCLKDRNTGRATGKTLALGYSTETGMLSVVPFDPSSSDTQGSPFRDESSSPF